MSLRIFVGRWWFVASLAVGFRQWELTVPPTPKTKSFPRGEWFSYRKLGSPK